MPFSAPGNERYNKHMTKTYIRSFTAMKYFVLLPVVTGISFIFLMLFFKTRASLFRLLALAAIACLFVILIAYRLDRWYAARCLSRLQDWRAYEDSMVIGQAFVLAERMLVYDRRVQEIHYADLKTVAARIGKKRTVLVFNDRVKNACRSLAQAQRFAAFLQAQNPTIRFSGIEPKGDGLREHIAEGDGL